MTQDMTTDPSIHKEETVQRMFSSIAHAYDFNNTLLSFGRHHAWKRFAVSQLDIREGSRLIDICAGTADLAILMAKQVGPWGSVTAMDLNHEMLQAVSWRRSIRIVDLIGKAEERSWKHQMRRFQHRPASTEPHCVLRGLALEVPLRFRLCSLPSPKP